jgi:hypothetical protein
MIRWMQWLDFKTWIAVVLISSASLLTSWAPSSAKQDAGA